MASCVALSCKEDKPAPTPFVPNTGQIQILNGCGIPGAAEEVRNYLIDFGFDVVEFGNASSWKYPSTLVVARTENTDVAKDIATLLGTDNWYQLMDSTHMVAATVFVGKDYYQRLHGQKKFAASPAP